MNKTEGMDFSKMWMEHEWNMKYYFKKNCKNNVIYLLSLAPDSFKLQHLHYQNSLPYLSWNLNQSILLLFDVS